MSAKRGLGTGLGALFGEEEQAKSEVELVPIARLEPREGQPRANFDEESLAELASSIAEYGLIQPITVRRLPSGYYQIIAGERRWRASRLAGLGEVPVRIIEADDRLATELGAGENLQREDLNPPGGGAGLPHADRGIRPHTGRGRQAGRQIAARGDERPASAGAGPGGAAVH